VLNAINSSTTPNAPYLRSLLAWGALVTNYFADTHPSIDNYFILTDGKSEANNDDQFSGVVNDDNIVRELASAGKSWKVYAEGIPSAGYLGPDIDSGSSLGAYVKHHNPFAYFSDVVNNPQEATNIVPFSQFAADVNSSISCTPQSAQSCLPNYAFIVPNTVNDGEFCPSSQGGCATAVRVADADAWLQNNIAALLATQAFQQNGLLIIIFDEADLTDTSFGSSPSGGGGHVFALLLGAGVKQGYTQQSTNIYDHRSALRLTTDSLGLLTQLPISNAAPMTEFFK
jgi:acid phosphatase